MRGAYLRGVLIRERALIQSNTVGTCTTESVNRMTKQ